MRDQLDLIVRYRLTLILAPRNCVGHLRTRRAIPRHLTDRAATRPWPVLWFRLAPCHNKPSSFISGLRRVLGELVDLPPVVQLSAEDGLIDLLNALLEVPTDFGLVLEAYDVIRSKAVHSLMARMLEYLPPQMHVIIITEREPELPNLARLRVRRQVLTLSFPKNGGS